MSGFSSNMRTKLVGLRRIILGLGIFYEVLVYMIFIRDTYILVVCWIKQNKDAVWSLGLLFDTGVRTDPKYSYSYI